MFACTQVLCTYCVHTVLFGLRKGGDFLEQIIEQAIITMIRGESMYMCGCVYECVFRTPYVLIDARQLLFAHSPTGWETSDRELSQQGPARHEIYLFQATRFLGRVDDDPELATREDVTQAL